VKGTCWLQRPAKSSRSHIQQPTLSGGGFANGKSTQFTYPSSLSFTTDICSSGDTGVAASLILHGSPPFQVYYRTRRQDYSRDLVKTFSGFRGELTIALEQSGDYIHSFFQMSDANYKKVELNGPSIRHTVYAPAEFVHGGPREVDSCSRGMIDVEVDLKVSFTHMLRTWIVDMIEGIWAVES